LIVLFDIADAKRRNSHLGYRTVDDDIQEMNRLLKLSVGTTGLAKRIGGDEWLAFYPGESLRPVVSLLNAYHQEQRFEVGWRATAEKGNQTKSTERTAPATICRSLRCIYVFTINSSEVDALIDSMLQHNYGLPPDIPLRFSEVITTKKIRWMCVTNYPEESPSCPFCRGSEFDWDEGDSNVYTGSGRCKRCTAYVDITGVEVF
jgi:hypothetical protein